MCRWGGSGVFKNRPINRPTGRTNKRTTGRRKSSSGTGKLKTACRQTTRQPDRQTARQGESSAARIYLLPPPSPNIPSGEDCPKETARRFCCTLPIVEPREVCSLLLQIRSSPVATMCHRRRAAAAAARGKSGEAPGGRGTRRHSPFPAAEVMRVAPAPLQAACLGAANFRPVPSSASHLPPFHTLHVADSRGAQRLPRRLEDAQPCVGSGGHVVPMAVCRRERGAGE